MDQSSENAPAPSLPENNPTLPISSPEVSLAPEISTAKTPEVGANQINKIVTPPQTLPALTLPPVSPPAVTNDTPTDIAGPTPVIADDVDLIEKEWVDKAKQIVENTKTDPYRQEQAVEQLQRSYLKKRYNKDLKSPNN